MKQASENSTNNPEKKSVRKREDAVGNIEGSRKLYEEIHFVDTEKPVWNYSIFSEEDITNFQNGTHYSLYNFFGSREIEVLGTRGYYFAVWAPNASFLSVVGNFNDWNLESHPLFVRLEKSGIWEGFIPHMKSGEVYKYHIHGYKGKQIDKGDPFAWFWERRPDTASITWKLDYNWSDDQWMEKRKINN